MFRRSRLMTLAAAASLSLAGCGLNSVPTAEEQVNAAWGNVQSEYQRRADLIRFTVTDSAAAWVRSFS